MNHKNVRYHLLFLLIIGFLITGCGKRDDEKTVVIYTAVDQIYSSKIFQLFENRTGIKVKPLYDTEASKAIGLRKRLLIEKDHPRADIFWNSEPLQTMVLKSHGIFESLNPLPDGISSYRSTQFFDSRGRWFGFGGRKRVVVVNTNGLSPEKFPRSLQDLWEVHLFGKTAISYPFSGTTAAHFSALYKKMGAEAFHALIEQIRKSGSAILAGNSVVMEAVGSGKFLAGMVDSDDVQAGLRQGFGIKSLCYDQNGSGNFMLFGTVSLVKGAPHPDRAKQFIEFLLDPEVEKELIRMGAFDTALLSTFTTNECLSWSMPPEKILEGYRESRSILTQVLQ